MAFPLWIIVASVMFIVMLIVFKTMNQVYLLSLVKKHFFNFFVILVFIFLAISLVYINSQYDVDYTSYEGLVKTSKIYFSWILNVFSNFGKLTGYAVQQNWVNATDGG